MRYKIKVVDDNHYQLEHYVTHIDNRYINRKIKKSDFGRFACGKLDITNYDEVEYKKLAIQEIKQTTSPTITDNLTDKEIKIMDYVCGQLQDQNYLIENNIVDTKINKCSKSLIKRTITNPDILIQYNLQRTRANKTMKQKLKIDDLPGFPSILYKNK